jgi:hydrogenase nickel incorporation protein HypA/HybF
VQCWKFLEVRLGKGDEIVHEGPIVETILTRALSEARDNERVTHIQLVVGEFASHSPEALSLHFELAASGSVAEGAFFEARRERAHLYCPDCGLSAAIGELATLSCPSCEGSLEAVGVHEVRLVGLELRDILSGQIRVVNLEGVQLR